MLRIVQKLKHEDLFAIANEEILAVQVKNFIPSDLAQQLTQKILGAGYAYYENASTVGRIGMAFYETNHQPEKVAKYFSVAQENIDEFRSRCFPLISPIDLVRCTLDETWLAGAQLARLYGKKMYVGLSRVIEKDVPLLAHHDILAKDAPDSFMAHSLQAQLACNVYVDVPDNGGNLQIWEQDVTADEFDKLRGKSYGIEPEKLGAPTIEVNLESGDLVFFNSRKMHAVTASPDRARLSVSCFIGYTGCHEPLIFWS